MLRDALKSEKLGSLENVTFLLKEALSSSNPRSISDIATFCEEKAAVFASTLDSTLSFLAYLSFIEIDESNRYLRTRDFVDKSDVATRIAEKVFTTMSEDGILSEFISPESIEYDPVEDSICIRNNFIPLDFSGLKNFLIAIGFLKQHHISANLLMISKEYKRLFDDVIVPSIKSERFSGVHPKNLSLAALKKIQELNEIHGKEAEEFVVDYEQKRLGSESHSTRIKRISDIQCDAGYDVVSFENPSSVQVDRFIEVKSYSGELSFFWSRNEVAVAEIKNDSYFLYLVHREKMSQPGYEPLMIRNPYEMVFLNKKEWPRDEMSWHFYK